MPPIYQPEIAAAASPRRPTPDAANAGRRGDRVGVTANKLLPGLGDWYLARTGIQGQMTDQPQPQDAPDNMFHPLDDDKDWGMHGRFDGRARNISWQLPLDMHRSMFAAALAVTAASLWGVSRALRR